jgi:hypothetical protein
VLINVVKYDFRPASNSSSQFKKQILRAMVEKRLEGKIEENR